MTESTRRFSKAQTLGAIGAIGAIIASVVLDRFALNALFKFSPFILVFGFTFFMLLGGYKRAFLSFLADSIKTLFSEPAAPNPTFAAIAKHGSRYALGSGMIGMVFGLIQMLSELSNAESMGPAIASTFISLLYALILSEFFFGFLYKAYQGQNVATSPLGNGQARPLGMKWLFLAFGSALLLLSAFFMMMYALSSMDQKKLARYYECTVQMGPFETNIGDPKSGHIIRFEPCLAVNGWDAKGSMASHMSTARDRIIKATALVTDARLFDPDFRENFRNMIRDEVNSVIDDPKAGSVTNVLFQNFLVK